MKKIIIGLTATTVIAAIILFACNKDEYKQQLDGGLSGDNLLKASVQNIHMKQ